MKKITFSLFLSGLFLMSANSSNAFGIDPIKPIKKASTFLAPVNDNCLGAIAITSFPYFNEQTDGATAAADGIVEACLDWEMNDGMWYVVVGNGNNIEIKAATEQGYDIALGVFTGSCDALICVETVDDVSYGEESIVIPSSEVGTLYYINIGHYHWSTDFPEGNFTIEVNSVEPPELADCSPAAIFPLDETADMPVGWVDFSWEIPTTGGEVSSYDLYIGTATPLTSDDFIGNFEENAAMINVSGFSTFFYWKAVPRNAGGPAADCIEWTFTTVEAPSVPVNDACETATAVTDFPFYEEIDATSATNNEGVIIVAECGSLNDGIWYTMEGNGGDIVVKATSLGWDGELAVYTGSCGAFTCHGSIDAELADSPEIITIEESVIGTVYYINFGHWDGTEDKLEGPAIIEITSEVLGIDDNQFKNFTAYPNPIKEVLYLSHTGNISSVEVFNMLGQKMLISSAEATHGQLDFSGFSNGSYLVKVTSGSETKAIKVVKQ